MKQLFEDMLKMYEVNVNKGAEDCESYFVVYSLEREICEPAAGIDELKIVLAIDKFTIEDFENGSVLIFVFNSHKEAEDLFDYFEGYKDACEALRDFEDYVVDLDYQAYIDGRPLTAEQEDWIKSERFDLMAKIERYEIDLEVMIQNVKSRV